MDVGQGANGRQVLWSAPTHELELAPRLLYAVQIHQRPPKRDSSGQVPGMDRKADATDVHRLFVLTGAAELFCELGESNGRRILLDPASKVV